MLEDNVRTPSGISYVLENRRAMTRLLPRAVRALPRAAGRPLPGAAATALEEVAPTGGEEEATVVVWTPGPYNSAYFEHAFLARQMGVELVEASDLVVRDAVCHIRTTRGLQRVHAIYRRIDDDFMDPLEFRPDSVLGVPGLMRAYRAGSVAIVNAVGTGVADDKAIYHYVPEMIRYYLGEEPIVENVPTYLMSDREQREWVLGAARPASSSSRPASPAARASSSARARPRRSSTRQAAEIKRAPERWIAQDLVHLSTVPTAGPDGTLAARHVDLRPFAVFGDDIRIVPGGLTRVALREGSMIVNSSQGGGSKDTWVLEADAEPHADTARRWRRGSRRRCRGCRSAAAGPPSSSNNSSSHAGPDRPRALLDRPPARARRAHLAHARRRLPRRPPGPPRRPRRRPACAGTRC